MPHRAPREGRRTSAAAVSRLRPAGRRPGSGYRRDRTGWRVAERACWSVRDLAERTGRRADHHAAVTLDLDHRQGALRTAVRQETDRPIDARPAVRAGDGIG